MVCLHSNRKVTELMFVILLESKRGLGVESTVYLTQSIELVESQSNPLTYGDIKQHALIEACEIMTVLKAVGLPPEDLSGEKRVIGPFCEGSE